MRAIEILSEGEHSTVESDLTDLLIAAKANKLEEVDMEELVDQLNSMGHAVTSDSIVDTMNEFELEFVDNVTLNTITLKTHTAEPSHDTGDDDGYDDSPD